MSDQNFEYYKYVELNSDLTFKITNFDDRLPTLQSKGVTRRSNLSIGYDNSPSPQHEVPGPMVAFVAFKGNDPQATPTALEYAAVMMNGDWGESSGGTFPPTQEMSDAFVGLNDHTYGERFVVAGPSFDITDAAFVVFEYEAFQNDLSSGRVTAEGHFS